MQRSILDIVASHCQHTWGLAWCRNATAGKVTGDPAAAFEQTTRIHLNVTGDGAVVYQGSPIANHGVAGGLCGVGRHIERSGTDIDPLGEDIAAIKIQRTCTCFGQTAYVDSCARVSTVVSHIQVVTIEVQDRAATTIQGIDGLVATRQGQRGG